MPCEPLLPYPSLLQVEGGAAVPHHVEVEIALEGGRPVRGRLDAAHLADHPVAQQASPQLGSSPCNDSFPPPVVVMHGDEATAEAQGLGAVGCVPTCGLCLPFAGAVGRPQAGGAAGAAAGAAAARGGCMQLATMAWHLQLPLPHFQLLF